MKSKKFAMLAVVACAFAAVGFSILVTRSYAPPVQVADAPTTATLFDAPYHACIDGGWPTQADARRRSDACSQALQGRPLPLAEIALARLTRGVARTHARQYGR
jgi:hypothetical protein